MRRSAFLVVVVVVLALAAVPSMGTDTGTVTNTVTTPAPCMTLDQTTLDWGTKGFSRAGDPIGTALQPVIVGDCSGQTQSLLVAGTEARSSTSVAVWQLTEFLLGCSLGPDLYVVWADNLGVGDTDDVISIQDGVFQNVGGVPVSGTTVVSIGLTMPCEGSSGQGETMTFGVDFLVTIP